MYGPRSDALNRGAPTDRLIAVWETIPGPSRERPDVDLPRLIRPDDATPEFTGLPTDAPYLRLDIPTDVHVLRAGSPLLAGAWSTAVRRAFLAAFAAGYRAVGFRDGAYILELHLAPAQPPNGSSIQRA
jgi:predicted GNAT superfamily acetyltransferase